MKDLSIAKLKKLIDMLREKNITSFKYKDIEFTIKYSPEPIPQEIKEETELTPEELKKQEEALINWSA